MKAGEEHEEHRVETGGTQMASVSVSAVVLNTMTGDRHADTHLHAVEDFIHDLQPLVFKCHVLNL